MARNWRLTRLRFTAPPTDLVAMIPAREYSSNPFVTTTTASGCAYDRPVWRTRLKSFAWVIRYFRFTRCPVRKPIIHFYEIISGREEKSPVDFLYVVIAGNRQMMAAFSAPSFQYFATIRCGHSGTKPMYPHTAANSWLVGPLGHSTSSQFNTFILNSQTWIIP